MGVGTSALIGIATARLIGISATDQLVLTGIFVLGLAQMLCTLWSSFDGIWLAPLGLILGASLGTIYFALEKGFALIVAPANGRQLSVAAPILLSFLLIVLWQANLTRLSRSQLGRRLYVHARNGFYFNTLANRLTMAVWPLGAAGDKI